MRSDLKGRGLGHLLLAKMIAYLGERGTQRVVGIVLRENRDARAGPARTGFRRAPADPDTVTLVKTLRPLGAPAKEDADPSR